MEPVKKHRIYLPTLHACMVNLILGVCVGWSSPTIPKLREHTADSPLSRPITKEEEGWISSIIALSACGTSLIGGYLANWIGRKWTILLSGLFMLVSFIILIVGHTVWMILLARGLEGFGGGLILTALPMYIGEVATDDCRGSAATLKNLLMIVGVIYSYAIGPYVRYIVLQWCCLAVPLLFVCTFYFIPDTPHYYAMKGRKEDAKKSLQFYRGQSADAAENEMVQIQAVVDEALANRGKLSDIFRNRGYRKALSISCTLLCFQQLTGISVVTYNSQTIFTSANSTLDPPIASLLLPVVQFTANFITPFVVDWSGRRVILMISCVGMCLALLALGTFFYIQAFSDASVIIWIPIPALVLFNLMYSFGLGPIPHAMLAEMFPSKIKGIAMCIAASVCWLSTFLVTRWFPNLNALGLYYLFWMFGCFCVVVFLYVVFILIETKGLSAEMIHEKLNQPRNSRKHLN